MTNLIRTFTGRMVDPFNMKADDIHLLDIAHALSMTCRYGGHCGQFYSVAEHSWHVSTSLPRENALWGLLHDAAEAYLGDIPTPIKRRLGAIYSDAEFEILKLVAEKYGLPKTIPEQVHQYDRQILEDEMTQMMGYSPGHISLGRKIFNWSPEHAKHCFIVAFSDLHDV